MKSSEKGSNSSSNGQSQVKRENQNPQKPKFMPAKDDTKPALQDPILRSDPIETEEAVLRLPTFPITNP